MNCEECTAFLAGSNLILGESSFGVFLRFLLRFVHQRLTDPCRAGVLIHMLLKLRPEILQSQEDRTAADPRKITVRGMLHGGSDQFQPIEILELPLPLDDPVKDFA